MTPAQQDHEEKISGAYHELIAASEPQKRRMWLEVMCSLIRQRDPSVMTAMEAERMQRVCR